MVSPSSADVQVGVVPRVAVGGRVARQRGRLGVRARAAVALSQRVRAPAAATAAWLRRYLLYFSYLSPLFFAPITVSSSYLFVGYKVKLTD